MGEVIPVDFKNHQRMPQEFLPALTRLSPRPNGVHEPGSLSEIGQGCIVTWPEQLGIPEPEPALTREEMIARAARAIMKRLESSDDESVQQMDEALSALDEDDEEIAWQLAFEQ